ncbi:MAG: hypothetical protein NC341_12290 [Blautia sp.]|nr:hypothetical protein [Blautia sp.]
MGNCYNRSGVQAQAAEITNIGDALAIDLFEDEVNLKETVSSRKEHSRV